MTKSKKELAQIKSDQRYWRKVGKVLGMTKEFREPKWDICRGIEDYFKGKSEPDFPYYDDDASAKQRQLGFDFAGAFFLCMKRYEEMTAQKAITKSKGFMKVEEK